MFRTSFLQIFILVILLLFIFGDVNWIKLQWSDFYNKHIRK